MDDPIGDLLIRIKNGYQARKKVITMPFSKMKEEIGQLLVKEKYLEKCSVRNEGKLKFLDLNLKYEGKTPALTGVKRISKPAVRVYRGVAEIPKFRSGYGITIISTSKGIMTGKEAKKNRLGGEIICQVWQ